MSEQFKLNSIGITRSPFRQKFGIPRQPGLCPSVPGQIELIAPCHHVDTVRGLDEFSHIWVLFLFHAIEANKWTPLVRPPRLGGNERMGVFATRSTHRPNPIGQSVVRLESIEHKNNHPVLHISGHDLLDGTPILDIKPYVPYSDAIPNAADGFIGRTVFQPLKVQFSTSADEQCKAWEQQYPTLQQMLIEILQQDPRPAYHKQSSVAREYGLELYQFNIRYRMENDKIQVQTVQNCG